MMQLHQTLTIDWNVALSPSHMRGRSLGISQKKINHEGQQQGVSKKKPEKRQSSIETLAELTKSELHMFASLKGITLSKTLSSKSEILRMIKEHIYQLHRSSGKLLTQGVLSDFTIHE